MKEGKSRVKKVIRQGFIAYNIVKQYLEEREMKKIILIFIIINLSLFCKIDVANVGLKDFDEKKILGTWYEIVKKENKYVADIQYSTTTYTKIDDREFSILTKGINEKNGKEDEIKGHGRLKTDIAPNMFEAKFFGLPYKDYVILDYDKKNYSYLVLRGQSSDYFWIIAKTKTLDNKLLEKLLNDAEKAGITREKLIYVKQK